VKQEKKQKQNLKLTYATLSLPHPHTITPAHIYLHVPHSCSHHTPLTPSLIQMDIGGHPPFPTGSKQFSDILAIYYF
jgi:hypothetical protein